MLNGTTIVAIIVASASCALAQSEHSPYAGQDHREIKSLSAQEIGGYLAGEGMGLAKAAELNHYPGPAHVLDLAEKLRLSREQAVRTKTIHDKMRQEAVALGKLIVDKESKLDHLFATGQIDKPQLESVVTEIARLQGQLRAAHLSAHLQMKEVLSDEQISKYDELRGYEPSQDQDSHSH